MFRKNFVYPCTQAMILVCTIFVTNPTVVNVYINLKPFSGCVRESELKNIQTSKKNWCIFLNSFGKCLRRNNE